MVVEEAEVWRRQDARLVLRVLGGGDEALGDKVLVVETDEVEVAELLVVAPPGAQLLRLAPDVRRALERLLAAVHDEHLRAVVLHARREQQRREHLRDVLGTAEARDHHAHANAEPGADVHRRLRNRHRQEGGGGAHGERSAPARSFLFWTSRSKSEAKCRWPEFRRSPATRERPPSPRPATQLFRRVI